MAKTKYECTSQELAYAMNVSVRRIRQLDSEGVIEAVRREGQTKYYEAIPSITKLSAYYTELANKKVDPEKEEFEKIRLKRNILKMELEKKAVEEVEASLHKPKDIYLIMSVLMKKLKKDLITETNKAAKKVVGLKNTMEIAEIIDTHIRHAMNEAATVNLRELVKKEKLFDQKITAA